MSKTKNEDKASDGRSPAAATDASQAGTRPSDTRRPDQRVHPGPDLNGAAVLDEHGVEVPITEEMINRALEDLDGEWQRERHRRADSGPSHAPRAGGKALWM